MPNYRCNKCGHEKQVDSVKFWFRDFCHIAGVACVMRVVRTRSERRRKARGKEVVSGQLSVGR